MAVLLDQVTLTMATTDLELPMEPPTVLPPPDAPPPDAPPPAGDFAILGEVMGLVMVMGVISELQQSMGEGFFQLRPPPWR